MFRAARLSSMLAVLAFASLVATGCGRGASGDAICTVGDTTVASARFDQELASARSQAKAHTGTAPTGDDLAALRRQVTAQLVIAAAWQDLARQRGISITDDDVARAERDLVEHGFDGERARYEQQLEVDGRTPDQARAELRDQLIVDAVRRHASTGEKVSEAEGRAWLQEHPADFGGTPRRRDVQHVLVRAGGQAGARDDAAARAFVERAWRRLRGANVAQFAAIATRFSDDPSSADRGGAFTYEAGTIDAAFERVAFELDVDEVSRPVRTPLGWHVVAARGELVDAQLPDYEDVADDVRDAVRDAERDAVLARLQGRVERLAAAAECGAAYRPRKVSITTSTTKTTPKPRHRSDRKGPRE